MSKTVNKSENLEKLQKIFKIKIISHSKNTNIAKLKLKGLQEIKVEVWIKFKKKKIIIKLEMKIIPDFFFKLTSPCVKF